MTGEPKAALPPFLPHWSYLGKTSLPGKERRGTSRPIPGPRCSFLDRTSMGFSAGWVATLTITLLLKM